MKQLVLQRKVEKSGEGSKGGHIIAHTKNGKPVYAGNHAAYSGRSGLNGGAIPKEYEGYSYSDHHHARDMHERLGSQAERAAQSAWLSSSGKYGGRSHAEWNDMSRQHYGAGFSHRSWANSIRGKKAEKTSD